MSLFGLPDLLPLCVAFIALWKTRAVKPFYKSINEDCLSLQYSVYLRGVFALVVLLHHISLYTEKGIILHMFYDAGVPAVAVFFFLSGYGLEKQFLVKGVSYRRSFLLLRIPTILFPYGLLVLAAWALFRVLGMPWTLRQVLEGFVNGNPIVPFSWYILTSVCFYLAFWLLMYICKNNQRILCGAIIWYCLYAMICYKRGFGIWWYNTAHLLIVGMAWAFFEKRIMAVVKQRPWALYIGFALSLLLFITTTALKGISNRYYCTFALSCCDSLLFVFLLLSVLLKFRAGNPILLFLGERSLEIYLSQGLIIYALRNKFITVTDDFLFSILVMAGVFAVSSFLYLVNRRILTAWKRTVRQRREQEALMEQGEEKAWISQ